MKVLLGYVALWLCLLIVFVGLRDSSGMVLMDYDMHQGLCFITTFMNAHIGSRLSSMVMLHYGYVYKLRFSDYDIHYRVLQSLDLVMFATSLFWHSKIDQGLSWNVQFVHEYVVLWLCSFMYFVRL